MTLSLSPFGARSTYTWGQTAETIDITFPVAQGATVKDISITITSNSIQAGLKGSDAFVVQGLFWGDIADSLWQLESNIVTIHLDKSRQNEQWPFLIRGPSSPHERVDPTSEFELAKYAEFSELDDEKAASHYQSAAKRGHLLAQLKMAHLLTAGFLKPTGDSSKADAEARLYLDMAIMMHDSPEAMVLLANMPFTADNQRRKWLAEAAARLDYPPAMYLLGKHEAEAAKTRTGSDKTQSEREAVRWWRRAATMDEARSCAELGFVFFNGLLGEKKDAREAEKYFTKARRLDPSVVKEYHFPSAQEMGSALAEYNRQRPSTADLSIQIPDDDDQKRLKKKTPSVPDFVDFDIDSNSSSPKISPQHSPRRRPGRGHPHRSRQPDPVFSGTLLGGAIVAAGFVVGAFLLHKFISPAGSSTASSSYSARFADL